MRTTVVGTGYVGLVTGACLAEIGNEVVCHDVDSQKIGVLKDGGIPIYEPGLAEMVGRNARDGRLQFSDVLDSALEGCQICFIAVGTPPDEDGSADRRYVTAAVRAVAEQAQSAMTLVVKSTVPVGTCAQLQEIVQETLKDRDVDFAIPVVSNPEFLREGRAIEDFMRPDRIVVGVDQDDDVEPIQRLYRHFIRNGHRFLIMTTRSSEMTKYAANVMLATRVSIMNELAQISHHVGADIMDVRTGVGTDSRIGMAYLYPGVGFGGSCFPKDVRALSRLAVESGAAADILDAVERVNRHQKMVLANRVVQHFGGELKGRHIAVWGISFKPKTDDIREAPALAIIKRLTDVGATVAAYDPEAIDNARRHFEGNERVSFCTDMYDVTKNADALILVTEWAMFRNADFERLAGMMRQPTLFDGRNQYDPARMQSLGFEYHSIGRTTRV